MPYLLNLLYLLLIAALSPWLLWAAVRKGKYREGYREKLLGLVPWRTSDKKCIWLHAVSVGEVNLLSPLLRQIRRERPEWECAVSTTTMTGMALARKKYPDLTVFYCPLDFTWAVKTAMRRIRPDVLVLAELELWPNLVAAARQVGARVAVVNGRLSEHSFKGYRKIRPLMTRLLRQIDLIAAQDETCASRFLALGARPESLAVTGSMKYDGAQTDRNNPSTRRLAELAGIAEDDVVFLAGSTQEPEEAVALAVYRQLSIDWPKLRLILVPRHPERFDAVAKHLDDSGVPWQRRTALIGSSCNADAAPAHRGEDSGPGATAGLSSSVEPPPDAALLDKPGTMGKWSVAPRCGLGSSPEVILRPVHSGPALPSEPPRVLLVDVIGELGSWWGTAQIAFVGGSLGSRGGQNMIEPAAYGAAVSFGPNTRNFRDIVATMLAHNAAVVVADQDDLIQFVRGCLEKPQEAAAMGQRARELVLRQLGATEQTFRRLTELVESQPRLVTRDQRAAA